MITNDDQDKALVPLTAEEAAGVIGGSTPHDIDISGPPTPPAPVPPSHDCPDPFMIRCNPQEG